MTRFGLRAVGVMVMALVSVASPGLLQAQPQKLLTLDDLYDPARKVNFGAPSIRGSGYTWVNDREYLRVKDARTPQAPGAEIVRVDALTGTETPLFDQARLAAALGAVPGTVGRRRGAPQPAADIRDEPGERPRCWSIPATTCTSGPSAPIASSGSRGPPRQRRK